MQTTSPPTPGAAPDAGRRFRPGLILALVSGAQFMVVLDIAVVNVALPSIESDLGLAAADLQWVVITYGLTLGGLLLLGGRAADLFGRRRVLTAGLAVFTLASLTAGVADSLALLVASRAAQGVGAAMASPAALSILVSTFREGPERNRALGVFGAVGGSAAAVGVILSGALTAGPGWPWIFLINVPIGVVLVVLVLRYVPAGERVPDVRTDLAGALTVTAGLMGVVYAINRSVEDGWTSASTLAFVAIGLALLAAFVAVERRASAPLVPLGLLRRPALRAATASIALSVGAFFATIFQASLFMQQVLRYSALRTGVAYLAIAVVALVAAAALAAPVIGRIGAARTLAVGQVAAAVGLLLLAQAPADASYPRHLLVPFVLLGAGIGLSNVAAQVVAFVGVEDEVAGVVGGIVETAREVGGALGTAIVASVAIARADDVLAALGGAESGVPLALSEGFQRGALVAAGFSVAAVLVALGPLRRAERAALGRSGATDVVTPGEQVADAVVTVTPVPPVADRMPAGECLAD